MMLHHFFNFCYQFYYGRGVSEVPVTTQHVVSALNWHSPSHYPCQKLGSHITHAFHSIISVVYVFGLL